MNKRKFTKYAVYTIAILSAYLINQLIIDFISKRVHEHGYFLVLVDMLIIVLIFAPAFSIVSKYTKKLSSLYIKTSNKLTGNFSGTIVWFLIAFGMLFIFFAITKYNIDVFNDFKRWVNKI